MIQPVLLARSLRNLFMARRGLRDGDRQAAVPALRADPARAIFSPRPQLAERRGGDLWLRFLGLERRLRLPMDWHPGEWRERNQLASIHLHSMEYLEALESDDLVAAVDDWIAQNSPYRLRYWRDSWNACALSIRCAVWMREIARRRARLPAGFVARATASVAEQIRFLRSNLETDLGGNHRIKNVAAFLWGGRFFQNGEALEWGSLGRLQLSRELEAQILPDGMHCERSPTGHVQVMADLLECYALLEPDDLQDRLGECLDRMARAMVELTHPDGRPSRFNDAGLHTGRTPAECLSVYERLRARRAESSRVFALGVAGFFGAREGDSLVTFDCGPIAPDHVPAHGRGAALAFEWSPGGVRFLVDAGAFGHGEGEPRSGSRSTAPHNTVTLDDEDPSAHWKGFRNARRARIVLERYEAGECGFMLVGSHDGYAQLGGRPRHRRSVRASAARIEVEDEILGGDAQAVRARLLLHPEVEVASEIGGLVFRRGEVCARLSSPNPIRVVASSWCPDFGVRIPTSQVVIHYGLAPCSGEFTLERIPATGVGSLPEPGARRQSVDDVPGLVSAASLEGLARTVHAEGDRSDDRTGVAR